MKSPKVSIIIPYLNKEELDRCINSIKKQKYKNKEIISGTESTEGFKKRKSIGFMRNHLSKKAKGDILLFLDSDAEFFSNNELDKLVNLFSGFEKSDSTVVAITGLQVASKRNSLLNWLVGLDYEERIKSMGESLVDVGASTIIAIKAKIFREINGFIGFSVGEDWNFSEKLSKKGYKIYHTNKIKIYHYTVSSFFGYLKKQFKYTWYRVYHFKKYKKMTDSYTKPSMIMQTGLFFLLITYILISYFVNFHFITYIIFLLIFFWDIPIVLRVFERTKDMKVLLFLPLSFIRSFVRAIAVIKGFLDFYIRNKIIKIK